ncbi:hypothetical protein HOB25_03240 [bacterium]|jgi:hypothetical protein|nr:hypothetical protein [bacterium]MBT4597833.1 hypothetical protein [bacterium]MBT6753975.1 hypothetical protein [bacterium]
MKIKNSCLANNYLDHMKKVIVFVLGFTLVLSGLYFVFSPKEQTEVRKNIKNERSAYLDDYLKSDWLNVLPDQEWGEIEKNVEGYSYTYKEEITDDSKINKSVEYKETEKGEFQGIMQIDFSGKSDSYVVEIPKSFASHVDEINFSQKPSKIINPDPIVEFKKEDSKIEIESKENKKSEEIEDNLIEQILDVESKRCDELKGDEAVACRLSLIAKYRDSTELKEEISHLDMTQVSGGSVVAVFNGNMRPCKYIRASSERQRCYEYAYQILVDECHASSGKEYRDCVRDLSSTLPSFEEQRLFCGHIDDEDMRKECQGVAPVEACDEIENKEMRDKCKLNIARTNGDIKICDKVEDPDYKQACVAIIGIATGDESYCDKVEDDYLSGQCRVKLALQKNDKKICAKIKNENSRDLCYGHFLTDMDAVDESMCSQFNELFLKEMCQLVLAMKNKDTDKCMDPKIVSLENRAICLAGIAVKHGDADACGKIDPMLSSLGEDRYPVEIEEERILKQTLRDECYAAVAKKNKDKSICNKISDKKLRAECKKKDSEEKDDGGKKNEESEEEKTSSVDIPPFPEWFVCPIPENAKLFTTTNDIGSVMKYTDPNDMNKITGPSVRYRKPNFNDAYHYFCYNAEGEKHGPFKEYDQKTGDIRREGYFKNGEWDQLITAYRNGIVRSKVMYDEGVKQGSGEDYCTGDACGKGTLAAKGQYVDNKKQGTWQYYKNGAPTKRQDYIQGHGQGAY